MDLAATYAGVCMSRCERRPCYERGIDTRARKQRGTVVTRLWQQKSQHHGSAAKQVSEIVQISSLASACTDHYHFKARPQVAA